MTEESNDVFQGGSRWYCSEVIVNVRGSICVIALAGVACQPTRTQVKSQQGAEREQTFAVVAQEFARTWDAGDVSAIDGLLAPGQGFWVVYNPGVAALPFHYDSVTQAMAESSFGYFDEIRFECTPTSGGAPAVGNCDAAGDTDSVCQFGGARPVLHGAADHQLSLLPRDDATETRDALQNRARIVALERADLHFLSDANWGAVFYFSRLGGRWRLVAVDASDCSV